MRPKAETMKQTSHLFRENVTRALSEPTLKIALDRTTTLLRTRRAKVISEFPQYAEAREAAQKIKDHTLDNLGHYLRQFEENAIANGAIVHWAATPEEARAIVTKICKEENARSATRVKSMLGEEIGIGEALEAAGVERVETDLAEHIIQLAGDPPSHIVMPAMHKTHEQVAELFAEKHADPSTTQDVPSLVESARRELRPKFINADIAISGANFLIAETGSFVTVTNEGNAELTTTPPRTHIVTVGIEKMVPSLKHAAVFLRLLSRAAIGTEITQYTTFFNGPKREGDRDGPEKLHIVLVDNHRSDMLSDFLRPMLRCIRCGACMNHCPVYAAVGGHAYGAVYPGPMGSVLTPAMTGLKGSKDLPNACTLNGRCKEVCPVNIPLPSMLRSLRARQNEEGMASPMTKWSLRFWAMLATRPALYRVATEVAIRGLRILARGRGKVTSAPLASGWTATRDLPEPEAGTFMYQYNKSKGDI